jgi:hypothetical protein
MLMSMVLALAVLQQFVPGYGLPGPSRHPPQHGAQGALHAVCRLVVELARRDAFDERPVLLPIGELEIVGECPV